MDTLLAILLILLVVGVVIELVLQELLFSRLRARHPDIWQALGPPTKFFDDGGSANFWAVRAFFRRPEYQRQCSAELLKWARFIRIYDRIYYVVVIASVAAMSWYVWIEK